MARSGSTWTYNALRMIAEHLVGKDKVYASDFKSYEPKDGFEIEIIKAHDPVPEELIKDAQVVTTVRDLRDAFCSGVAAGLLEIASYPIRGLAEGIFDGIDLLFIEPSLYWKEKACRMVMFEQMMLDKKTILGQLNMLFSSYGFVSDLEWPTIALKLEYLPNVIKDYDPEQSYLFGRNHRQYIGVGGFMQHMPWIDAQVIKDRYKDWFDEFGYGEGSYYEHILEQVIASEL